MAVTTPFAAIEDAIEEIREGRFVVVVDDPDRENEGDLVIAAQFATPEAINFMVTHARGQLCLPLTEERADQLGLSLIAAPGESSRLGTAYTAAIDSREGIPTPSRGRPQPHRPGRDLAGLDPADLLKGAARPAAARQARRVLERNGQTRAPSTSPSRG
jgi:3,4-dihydroxy 2-butanone 4-phosphate synthase/GTP cyclohydrolase II